MQQGPPIAVTCFGGPRVLCAGQQIWPRPAVGDAKPWELLLFVACHPRAGVSSGDAAVALWPEDDADDPAHRFRQLRYRLRRTLAEVPGAPPTDGICLERGVLKLDPGVVYSDASEFLELVRLARLSSEAEAMQQLERARSLFTGDLLDGPDTRRYAWVDERDDSGVTLREHFRRLFHQTSTRLAELYASTGQFQASIDVYRELVEIDPGDERLWRALFRLHAQIGDAVALVREERRMREALRALAGEADVPDGELLAGPGRETVQEYQRLLATLHDPELEPASA